MLVTARLLIRDIRQSDIDSISPFIRTKEYLRYVPIEQHTPESASALLGRLMSKQFKTPRTGYHMIAVEKISNRFIGTIDLSVYLPWLLGEIGWAITPSRTGEGLATEMSQAILRYAFDTLRLHRVQARCSFENAASRQIMRKMGMVEEGVMRDSMFIRDKWWSTVQGAILSTDPQAKPAIPVVLQKP